MSDPTCAARPRAAMAMALGMILALSLGIPARAADGRTGGGSGFYLAGKGGPVLGMANSITSGSGLPLNDDTAVNVVGGFGMAAGYTWAKEGLPLRTEFEFMNRTEISHNSSPVFATSSANDVVGSDIQNITGMIKGYYHFEADNPKWSPFLVAGIGLSRTRVKGQYTPAGATPIKLQNVEYGLAWSAGVGVSFYLGNHVVNDIELSYADLGSADWGLPPNLNLKSSALSAVQLLFAIRANF